MIFTKKKPGFFDPEEINICLNEIGSRFNKTVSQGNTPENSEELVRFFV